MEMHWKMRVNYYPFGLTISEDGATGAAPNDYKLSTKELQTEFGVNYYDFGARIQDEQIGRWFQEDPSADKYLNQSPYSYLANNPIAFIDPDGRDIVYFNTKGEEVNREVSNTVFKTFVGSDGDYKEAPMPRIIKGYESPIYQKYDYDIAAQTYIFNSLSPDERPATPGGEKYKGDLPSDLDPTLVKAMVIEETKGGTYEGKYGQKGKSDIMQANVSTTSGQTDWNDSKKDLGLEKGNSATPSQSLYAGIRILYTKGLTTKTIKNAKGKTVGFKTGWKGTDWNSAVKNYNGGGNPNYLEEVLNYIDNSLDPSAKNYIAQ